jgi:hypothetical protein
MTQLRPEVRALVQARELLARRQDHRQALEFIAQSERHLAAARLLRREDFALDAHAAFYAAIWDALRALLEEYGLQLGNAKGEDGQHQLTMKFGKAELRDSSEERAAGDTLEPIRQQRNQNQYRLASPRLGMLPKIAGTVVNAARSRIGDS